MCSFIVSRLNKVNEQLEIISKLQKMEKIIHDDVHQLPANFSKENHCDNSEILKPCPNKHNKKLTSHQTKCMNCNSDVCGLKQRACSFTNINIEEESESKSEFFVTTEKHSKNKNISCEPDNVSSNMDFSKIENSTTLYRRKETDIPQTVRSNSEVILESYQSKEGKWDKKSIECLRKDLSNERKCRKELEKELEKVLLSIKSLKENEERQAFCLKEALKKADEQMELANKSKNFAVDLCKQCDLIKISKDHILNQVSHLKKEMNDVMSKNIKLRSECEDLKKVIKNEEKKSSEAINEVNKMKCSIENMVSAMEREKHKYEEMVSQLTNIVKIQKKRELALINLCDKQRIVLQQKDRFITEKEEKVFQVCNDLKSTCCENQNMKDKIENLNKCLEDKIKTNEELQKEIKNDKESYYCELKIKEKIIADKNDTINKQKKLLQDSEKMAIQVTREFEQLQNNVRFEKETNNSLKTELQIARKQLMNGNLIECRNCNVLETKIECTIEQKEKAVLAAKYTTDKLHTFAQEFQRQTENNKKHYKFMTTVLKEKEEEIERLKKEILHIKQCNIIF